LSRPGYLGEEGFADGEGSWLVALAQGGGSGGVRGLPTAYLLSPPARPAWLGIRAAWRPTTHPTELQDIAVLLMAGMFVLSPNYPWYFWPSCHSSRSGAARLRGP
jgi:hypothetical protein